VGPQPAVLAVVERSGVTVNYQRPTNGYYTVD
jgi:hypothetical protein